MMDGALLIWVLLVVLAATFVNGATDAPVLMSGSVLSGALSPRAAAVLSALGNGAGLLVSLALFPSVAETVTALARFGERGRVGLFALLAVLGASVTWAVAAWAFGIPTSESHALVAGLAGASVALGEGANILGASLEVLFGLALSLVGGYALCCLLLRAAECLSHRILCAKSGKFYRRASAVLGGAMSFMHGAQDGQKFTCLFLLALSFGGVETGRAACLLPALALSAGSACVGGKILETLGGEGALSPRGALASESAAALCLAVLTVWGLPVSTTHLKTAALAAAKKDGRVLAPRLVLSWLLTFPACFCLAFFATRLFLRL